MQKNFYGEVTEHPLSSVKNTGLERVEFGKEELHKVGLPLEPPLVFSY